MADPPRAYSPVVDGTQRKALSDFEWKADKAGAFRAVVATYNVVDKDGDVSIPGALDTTKSVLVSPWNHSSVDAANADPPVGAATIRTVGDKAVADGHFYLNTDMGRKAYEITKSLFSDGLGEWSYAFRIPAGGALTDSKSLADWPGAQRILAKVLPFEVSLVFAGAGVGTQTLSVKSALEQKVGARLSKESRLRLRSLATELLAFIGESELEPDTTAPKSLRAIKTIHTKAAMMADCPPEVMAAMAQLDGLIDQADEIADSMMDMLGIPDPDETPADEMDDMPKSETQAFLRAARDDMERVRASRFIDLRVI